MGRIGAIAYMDFNKSVVDNMLATMDHGYMLQNYYQNGNCMLMQCDQACKRILSLEFAGTRFSIVMDGELYNSRELVHELSLSGHQLTSNCDSEILLHAYIQWGREMPQKLLGAFAFAIWNESEKSLFVARDQMGVKPLFYSALNNGIIFASEIKTILAHPLVPAKLTREGIAQLLLIGPGRVPGSGVFKDIYELEPGMYGIFENNHFEKKRYWCLQDRIHTQSFEETAEEVKMLVLDSIKRQSNTQKSMGTLLSGGLDSSVISGVLAEKFREADKTLKTFSVDYEGNDSNFVPGTLQPERDNDYIKLMTEYMGSEHHWMLLNSIDQIACLEAATIARDLPGMGDVDFSLFAFCRRIKEYADVVLSGECADEIFGGYPWFINMDYTAAKGFPWADNVDYRSTFMLEEHRCNTKEFVMDHINTSLAQVDILPENSFLERKIKEMTWLNQYWFMQTLIDRNDRMSIGCGLEIRAPFCDHRIAEYMFAVPWSFKRYNEREKGLLRFAVSGIIPDVVLWRKKSPYPKTFDPAYTNMVAERLRLLLDDPQALIWNVVDRNAAEGLINGDLQKPWYGQLMKIPQTIAYMLQIDVWLNKYRVSFV